ncbi:heavy metal translocating P-type ATPase [Paraburkholderia rhizosphaerae]|uniref:P-type Zn(2+) transporter n=1 Tax=Paraburkholderia rhizosphaerae TaxID=480658 RepID=A0A4R8LTG4_9BURK|nr:heavy metal translocating P-type ATPase [Paraburkholderia rhizosphaerae]TDY50993.1 P-type E1-E2 ATPase/heavy metal translocating P-type ATPase [Paraburkholderia rhizosphaerae]
MPRLFRSVDGVLLAVSAGSLVIGVIFARLGDGALAHALWAAGASPVLVALLVSIFRALRRREAGVDVLALLAIGFALGLGEFLTAAVISLMLASGRALEQYAKERAHREMTALLSRAPRHANRFESGEWRRVELDAVLPGDRLLIRSGELVPVDGSLIGAAQLDESMLTGESVIRQRCAGESVSSGVLNAGAGFEIVAAASAQDSMFASIVRMVRAAQRGRSPAARLADRYALVFVAVALALAAGSWFVTGNAVRALAVLVVATPCPLILAVPVAIVSGMSRCAKRGVLVKGGGALERLAQASVLFFDKTGTLTGGRVRLVAIEASAGTSPESVLRFAACLGQASVHVISEAVTIAARERHLVLSVPCQVEEQPGAGVKGEVDGHVVVIGSFAYVSSFATPASWSAAFLQRLAYEGASAVFVGVDGCMVGALQMADQIRPETPRALRLLRQEGISRLVMLTGDRRDLAETIGAMLGVTEVRAELTPSDKLAAIHAARRDGTVVMVGDGINDAPALAAADVGVAMGARGATASSEAADVVLLVDRLDRLVEGVRVARQTRRIAVQSVIAGMVLSFAAMAVAALGYLPPLPGALLQEVIDVAVIVNALRVLRIRSSATAGSLAANDAERLRTEHIELGPVIGRIRELADKLPGLPAASAVEALTGMNDLLADKLLPHEQRDDLEVYPGLARLIGGEDPMAPMSAMHSEIFRITRLLRQLTEGLPPEGPDAGSVREFQRLLYELSAIVHLHCAQEDQLFHVLGEGA